MATWRRIGLFEEIPAGANPTVVVGGAAIVGSALTFMRSDAAPALGPLTRDLAFGGFKGTGLLDPTSPQDAATKAYVDALAQGLAPKDAVRIATTIAGTLASSFENGDTVDGVVLATGDRILIKDQSAGEENGVYVVNASGAPTRATDADSEADLRAAFFFVEEGTVNADTGWVQTTNAPITVNTTALVFAQFSGAGSITAGDGLLKTGNVLDVRVDATTIEISSDILRVKALGITDAHVAAANKDGTAGTPSLRTLGTGAAQAAAGNDARLSDARTPTAHASSHQPGGGDAMAVDAAAATGSLRTIGTGALTAAAGNDARFADARPPSSVAGGTAFDLGPYTNPLKGLGIFGYTTAGRPAAVANGFYFDTTLDRPHVATAA